MGKLLQDKLAQYTEPQKAQAAGIYPYFRKSKVIRIPRSLSMVGKSSCSAPMHIWD